MKGGGQTLPLRGEGAVLEHKGRPYQIWLICRWFPVFARNDSHRGRGMTGGGDGMRVKEGWGGSRTAPTRDERRRSGLNGVMGEDRVR